MKSVDCDLLMYLNGIYVTFFSIEFGVGGENYRMLKVVTEKLACVRQFIKLCIS